MNHIQFSTAIFLSALLVGCSGPSPQSTTRGESRAPARADRAAGQTRVDRRGIIQVWVPAGEFTMGTVDASGLNPPAWALREMESEQPAHLVRLTKGYWMDKFEVTNEAFAAFAADSGYENRVYWSDAGWSWRETQTDLPNACGEDPEHPVACVNWFEAEAYSAWRGGRLPTDAEWEFAARGPDSRIYPWGDEWDASRANVVDSEGTTAVGFFPGGVSWVGAHDMSGNVMEWVSDWLTLDYYQPEPMIDPTGAASGRIKIEKGGWWGSNPFVARAAYHHFEDPPGYNDHHIGFRTLTDQR